MVWMSIKGNQPYCIGILGALLLGLYGVIATLQPKAFGRKYSMYGRVFVFMSFLSRWLIDKENQIFSILMEW